MKPLLTDEELAEIAEDESPDGRIAIYAHAENRRVAEAGDLFGRQRPTPVKVYSIDNPPAWLVGRL